MNLMKVEGIELFNSENIVYHYTKIQTAIEYILYEKRLKLSTRKTSNDPIENLTTPSITTNIYNNVSAPVHDQAKVTEFIENKIKNAKQLCLCQNNLDIKTDSTTSIPYEYYGFLKPRMWDQYGDNYNGICLAFDLNLLKKNNPNIHAEKVDYINYDTFLRNNLNIDSTKLFETNVDLYCKEFLNVIKDISFRKHSDYSGENEYRFLSFNENEKFLNINNSLKAIIISERKLSPFAKKWLIKYSEDNNIEVFLIKWEISGVRITTMKDEKAINGLWDQFKNLGQTGDTIQN
jgi:hypothetical protein